MTQALSNSPPQTVNPPVFPHAEQARRLSSRPTRQLATTAPGDNGRAIVGHTFEFVRHTNQLIQRMSRQYGSNFRIRMFGYPVLIIGHPDQAREVLMDRDSNFSSHRGWEHAIGQLFARGLMLRDFEEHRLHRKIMQSAFRSDALRGYLEMMNPLIGEAVERWGQQERFFFYPAIKELTLDLAAKVFLGVPLGTEARQLNQAFVHSVAASIALIKLDWPFFAYGRGMSGRRLLERFFAEQIGERRQHTGRDLFTELCRAETETGEHFSDREVIDHMIFLLMAAHDTITSSLTSLAWALAQYPEWQAQLREEIAARPTLEWENRDSCPSVDLAFKEALRMFPPVPFIGRRSVRESRLGSIELPANSALNVCSLITHYSPEVWTNPRHFDPFRFSKERAEDKVHSHAYYPFGGGAHTCLGMHFASLQVKAFLFQFLPRYRLELEPGYRLDMRPIPIPRPSDGLPVRLVPINGRSAGRID